MTLQGELADFVLTAYNQNPAFIQKEIEAGEGGLQKFLVGVFSNIKATGIVALILPYIEGGVEGFVSQLIAKYTPEQIYSMLGAWLATEAKALGG